MINGVRKDVLTVLYTVMFLFISIFIILPYMVYFSTYMHERAHYRVLTSYGVEAYIELDPVYAIPSFFSTKSDKLGVTTFNSTEYMQLNKDQRTDVNIAGIVSDLWVLFFLGLYLALTNVYFFYKVKFTKNFNLAWILAVNWLLIMWLIALMQITIANVTYDAGDVHMLVRYLMSPEDCCQTIDFNTGLCPATCAGREAIPVSEGLPTLGHIHWGS